ncbi:MAG: threonine synthase [Armatimonadetes bacterium]|nr:threonine synthase [Armatimonadota bacterium]
MTAWPGVLAAFADRLPIGDGTPRLTLLEGGTPLIPAAALAREFPGATLYYKWEGANPTGSFKDRGMVVAVAKAAEAGAPGVVCASTGNTSASAAAYAARCGLRCVVILPEGKVAAGKLAQARMHGAVVAMIPGNFDDALRLARETSDALGLALVNSFNPYRLEGQKTAAFEIADALGGPPDILALPVGNAGNISAYWRGFVELANGGARPRLWGFQAAGAAPFVRGAPISDPETIATAIRIGRPASWDTAQRALAESGGRVAAVSDDEILFAQRRLAAEEGIFTEPASATCIAGLLRARQDGHPVTGHVVAVLTGHGLKDPAVADHTPPPVRIEATVDGVAALLAAH